jgi:CBS domain-containing protein
MLIPRAHDSKAALPREDVMLVQDLITRAPVAVSPGASLERAAARMRDAAVGSIVVTEDHEPVGILTDRDVALALAEGLEAMAVRDIMSPHPICIPVEADIEMCIERMEEFGVRRILVTEGDKLVGVVSLDDILIHLGYLMSKASSLIQSEIGVRLML